ncbi:hypothetical protein KQX54_016051 [Cotesia glomerata]|uniref:Uncharacterized protein n=1 Tax=Cotesia glomerata TaxID=32391 RepID=A0AAV7IDX5_COTGL|nr:hypothetical protein KQX54_016051 [Cotesia glomerata]
MKTKSGIGLKLVRVGRRGRQESKEKEGKNIDQNQKEKQNNNNTRFNVMGVFFRGNRPRSMAQVPPTQNTILHLHQMSDHPDRPSQFVCFVTPVSTQF